MSNNILRKSLARYSALTSSPRRSSASDLSGSALRITFSRYALSEKVGRRALQRFKLGFDTIAMMSTLLSITLQ
ncbi:hypothetical protein HMPREF1573_01142 [Gardnerella vaginalis JCP7276]|nr:hypothetical protein HMPREF1573_01142 [Gardnerella vaginalis JCP7276]